ARRLGGGTFNSSRPAWRRRASRRRLVINLIHWVNRALIESAPMLTKRYAYPQFARVQGGDACRVSTPLLECRLLPLIELAITYDRKKAAHSDRRRLRGEPDRAETDTQEHRIRCERS